jgi:hypothetical protein
VCRSARVLNCVGCVREVYTHTHTHMRTYTCSARCALHSHTWMCTTTGSNPWISHQTYAYRIRTHTYTHTHQHLLSSRHALPRQWWESCVTIVACVFVCAEIYVCVGVCVCVCDSVGSQCVCGFFFFFFLFFAFCSLFTTFVAIQVCWCVHMRMA